MLSDTEGDEFIESGNHCAACGHQSEGCEVTLLFSELTPVTQFKTNLFVCGRELIKHCSYFEGLLLGGFKENSLKEANVHDMSRSELLFFLKYAMHPNRSLPLGKDSLCTLIKVSDILICDSVQTRIATLLNTESFFFNAPADTKLELIKTADRHRGCSWDILDACIRSCVNCFEHSLLNGAVSRGTQAAVAELSHQLMRSLSEMKRMATGERSHLCVKYRPTPQMKPYDKKPVVELLGGVLHVWQVRSLCWFCIRCRKTEWLKNAITLEKFKQFEIDRTLLRC